MSISMALVSNMLRNQLEEAFGYCLTCTDADISQEKFSIRKQSKGK
jgi:hypothetical protein